MNSVASWRRGQLVELRGQLRLEAEAEAAAAVGLDGRTRPVGRQLEQLGGVGQLRAPVVELRLEVADCSRARCQAAKSAYWTASSGSGDGRPA